MRLERVITNLFLLSLPLASLSLLGLLDRSMIAGDWESLSVLLLIAVLFSWAGRRFIERVEPFGLSLKAIGVTIVVSICVRLLTGTNVDSFRHLDLIVTIEPLWYHLWVSFIVGIFCFLSLLLEIRPTIQIFVALFVSLIIERLQPSIVLSRIRDTQRIDRWSFESLIGIEDSLFLNFLVVLIVLIMFTEIQRSSVG